MKRGLSCRVCETHLRRGGSRCSMTSMNVATLHPLRLPQARGSLRAGLRALPRYRRTAAEVGPDSRGISLGISMAEEREMAPLIPVAPIPASRSPLSDGRAQPSHNPSSDGRTLLIPGTSLARCSHRRRFQNGMNPLWSLLPHQAEAVTEDRG